MRADAAMYVRDLIGVGGAWTVHGAWSHREHVDLWSRIKDAGPAVFSRALDALLLSNDHDAKCFVRRIRENEEATA